MIVMIWNALYEVHIPPPTEEMFQEVAAVFFEKCRFPNCLGAIDGKHVRIKCPNNSVSRYFNYKHFFFIVL